MMYCNQGAATLFQDAIFAAALLNMLITLFCSVVLRRRFGIGWK